MNNDDVANIQSLADLIASRILTNPQHNDLINATSDILKILLKNSSSQVSSWHPLGFLKLNIATVENIGDVRLHIWHPQWRNAQKPHSICHQHSWDLRSHILYGSITDEVYEVTPQDHQATHRVYTVSYKDGKSISQATDKTALCDLARSKKLTAGDTYNVPIGAFHFTQVDENEFSSTILVTYNSIDVKPLNIRPIDSKEEYIYERRACDPQLFSEIIEQLLLKINS